MPSWTTPVDHATGYVVTSTDWNNFFGANGDLAFLFGDSGWTNVSVFTNSWGNNSGPPGFILIGRVVYLRGALSAGTANTAAFTLPAGYRPSIPMELVVLTSTGPIVTNAVTINTSGTVVPTLSAVTRLDMISFPVV